MASAAPMAAAVRSGRRRAAEIVGRALESAAADTHNAFLSLDQDAGEEAATIDAAVSSGRDPGPLAGVPLAVKDIIDHRGRTTTAGSAFYRHRATATAPALARLEEAGAVVVGRTGLHEFAFGFSSENPWTGPVRNPTDPSLSPGGSSGGSAAAVAAGIVPVALGTDTGGSIRVPAALCGVVGLKVTHGLIPLDGVFPLAPSLDTVGALGGDLEDVALVTRVMAGSDPGQTEKASPSLPNLTLVVPRDWTQSAPMTPTVGDAFDDWLTAVAAAGARVLRGDLPELIPGPYLVDGMGPEVTAVHGAWRAEGRPYGEDVAARIDQSAAVTAERAESALTWRRRAAASLDELTFPDRLVLTPTVPALDKRIGDDLIAGEHYRRVLSWFTAPVNHAGHPALSVPVAGAGRTASVQLIGPKWSEAHLVSAGLLLREAGLVGPAIQSSDSA